MVNDCILHVLQQVMAENELDLKIDYGELFLNAHLILFPMHQQLLNDDFSFVCQLLIHVISFELTGRR